ncbi:MAG: H+transporting two-sector ATPase C subunit [Anaerolineae bacterium]|nr:H+transporting two-sector ATPase C subunit [Anaerolineae bacterium]
MASAVVYLVKRHGRHPEQVTRRLIIGLNGFNVIIGLMAVALGVIWLATPQAVSASAIHPQAAAADPYASLAAAISTGLAALAAGFAVSSTGAAAIGSIAEKPETFGRALIFVGLAEGIAIYGLLISFMILNR